MSGAGLTMAALSAQERWVCWQAEGRQGKALTKVPKAVTRSGNASCQDPSTWGTREQAEKRAESLDKPHGQGGIGVQLGDLGDGRPIGGLDLDTCRDPTTGDVEPWAMEVVQLFGSYTEVSPSGTGVKVFFQFDPLLITELKGRSRFKRGNGAAHPPAIELYLSSRYFAFTGEHVTGTPLDLRPVSRSVIEQLVREIGPRFAGDGKPAVRDERSYTVPAGGEDADYDAILPRVLELATRQPRLAGYLNGDCAGLSDGSRSSVAMAIGRALILADFSFAEMSTFLRGHPITAEWLAEKEDAAAERQLRRIWDRVEPPTPAPDGSEFDGIAPPPPPSRVRLLTPEDCANAPRRGYVVKRMIAPRDLVCLFGPPGAGKSVLAPYIGYAIARGENVFGCRVKQGGVFYVAAEDATGMRQRVRALRLTHGDAPNFHLVEGVGSLLDGSDCAALTELVAMHKPALIVIDTLAMAFPGIDENTAQDMGRVVDVARRFTAHGAAVLLIHHDTKAQDGTPRGHSILNGALDAAIRLSAADDQGVIRGKMVKNRNGACDLSLAFRIPVGGLGIGTDEDGDAVTAPIAHEVVDTGVQRRRLPRAAAGALAVLKGMEGAGDGRGVPLSEWRRACARDVRVCSSEDPKSRNKAAGRAVADLVDAGAVVIEDEIARLPAAGDEFVAQGVSSVASEAAKQ